MPRTVYSFTKSRTVFKKFYFVYFTRIYRKTVVYGCKFNFLIP